MSERVKQIVSRPLRPMTIYRGLFCGRYLPVGFEPPKVIETNDVAGLKRPFHALNPPVVSALAEDIPSIQRIPPALSSCAEEVRRHTRDVDRPAFLVELKDLRMAPDVGAIEIHENRDVSDQLDSF